ncbi:MAG: type 2 lantipeptide synthetase LanM [Cyanothece sp. SIO1E1]|nr:type 2 lantipeptide synthetase LanM [Cyanothece sp. SIO1E1]
MVISQISPAPASDQALLHRIVAQASSFSERLDNSHIVPTPTEENCIHHRLQTWQRVVAKGDEALFAQRLALDNLTVDALRPQLGHVRYTADTLPSWAYTLQTIWQTASHHSLEEDTPIWEQSLFFELSEPIAFEPFYIPCLHVAERQLTCQLGTGAWTHLSDSARDTLKLSLIRRLQEICIRTLCQKFSQFRSSGDRPQGFFGLDFQGHHSQQQYRKFLQSLFQDGLRDFFTGYAVLGKLVATVIDFWVESTCEFIQRLAIDWLAIQAQFSHGAPLTQVIDLKTNVSDPHNRGRSTIILTFDNTLRVVYKPKNLGTDVAYFQLLAWCNRQTNLLPLQTLQVLNRGTHGWVEYVKPNPCPNQAAVKRFYERSGMLLCLIYLLNGSDCHAENLVACGEQPILIDTETLMTPSIQTPTSELNATSASPHPEAKALASALEHVGQRLEKSVLSTLLLPIPNGNSPLDRSGFGGITSMQHRVMYLRDINTDGMRIDFKTITAEANANAPTLNHQPVSPHDYLEELTTGFEHMYRQVLAHHQVLLSANGPLQAFEGQPIRYVFRSTQTYAAILNQSYQPSLLQHGIDRSIRLDILSRAFLTQPEHPHTWPLLACEQQAMEQLDIPFFTVNSSSDAIATPNNTQLAVRLATSPFKQGRQRLQEASETDLAQQLEIIRGTFHARIAAAPDELTPENLAAIHQRVITNPIGVAESRDESTYHSQPIIPSKLLLQPAIDMAHQLRQSAIQGADGSLTWLGLHYYLQLNHFRFGGIGTGFTDGTFGIGLFLAALAKTTGDSQWRDLTLQAIPSLDRHLKYHSRETIARLVRNFSLGTATGLGGMLYGWVQIGQLLSDTSLVAEARQAASLIHPDMITADQHYNLAQGAAGLMMGLLALHRVDVRALESGVTPLELAIACGHHLVKQQTVINPDQPHLKAWMPDSAVANTGFFQGAAGISYALLQLFEVAPQEAFLQAAAAAIAYEQSVFSLTGYGSELTSSSTQFHVHWASGMAGIGLARLAGLSVLDTPAIRQEIATALTIAQWHPSDKVQTTDNHEPDTLCWGRLGRLETLLSAAQINNQSQLLSVIYQQTAEVLSRADTANNFKLFTNLPTSVQSPGFLHGIAGIGYQLLRFAHPDLLPCALRWETRVD